MELVRAGTGCPAFDQRRGRRNSGCHHARRSQRCLSDRSASRSGRVRSVLGCGGTSGRSDQRRRARATCPAGGCRSVTQPDRSVDQRGAAACPTGPLIGRRHRRQCFAGPVPNELGAPTHRAEHGRVLQQHYVRCEQPATDEHTVERHRPFDRRPRGGSRHSWCSSRELLHQARSGDGPTQHSHRELGSQHRELPGRDRPGDEEGRGLGLQPRRSSERSCTPRSRY